MKNTGVRGAIDHAEVGTAAHVGPGKSEVRFVEGVEELATKEHLGALADGKTLLDRKVEIEAAGSGEEVARGVAEGSDGIDANHGAIEVVSEVVVAILVGTARGVGGDVRPVQADGTEGVVAPGGESDGETGAQIEDVQQTPAAGSEAQEWIGVVELRQVKNPTQAETVADIELGESAVEAVVGGVGVGDGELV